MAVWVPSWLRRSSTVIPVSVGDVPGVHPRLTMTNVLACSSVVSCKDSPGTFWFPSSFGFSSSVYVWYCLFFGLVFLSIFCLRCVLLVFSLSPCCVLPLWCLPTHQVFSLFVFPFVFFYSLCLYFGIWVFLLILSHFLFSCSMMSGSSWLLIVFMPPCVFVRQQSLMFSRFFINWELNKIG